MHPREGGRRPAQGPPSAPSPPPGGGPTSAARPAAVGQEAEPLLQLQRFQGLLRHALLRRGGAPGAGVCRDGNQGRSPALPRRPAATPRAARTSRGAQHRQGPARPGAAPGAKQGHGRAPGSPLPAARLGCETGQRQQRALPAARAEARD